MSQTPITPSECEVRSHAPEGMAYEGDPRTWHIRLHTRLVHPAYDQPLELWALWNGQTQESSPTGKEFARAWMRLELAAIEKAQTASDECDCVACNV